MSVQTGKDIIHTSKRSAYSHRDITVVIPCYNQSEYVEEAIDSVLANSLRPYHILVLLMDKKSHVKRAALERKSPIVKGIISDRLPLPAARNELIRQVRTQYFIPLDADDKLPPNFIRQVSRLLPSDVVYVKSHTFGDYEEVWDNPNTVDLEWLSKDNNIPNTALIKTAAWRAVGGYNEEFTFGYEDWEFWVHLKKIGRTFKKCQSTYLMYRRHGQTLLHEAIERREDVLTLLRKTHPTVFVQPKKRTPIHSAPIQRTRRRKQEEKKEPAPITIIIPCYGYAAYVQEAVQSAIDQTLPVVEILIMLMDEKSKRLQATLEALGSNVRTIQSTQKYLPSARNVLIGVSTTKFFIPLDADDRLPETFIEEIMKHDEAIDVVYAGSIYFGAEQGSWPPDLSEEVDWDKLTTFRRNALVCTARVRRSAWEHVGGYNDNLRAYEDMEFWLHLYQTGHTFEKCKTTALEYRKHPTTSMLAHHNGTDERRRQLHKQIMNIHSEVYNHIPKIIHYVWMGDKERPDEFIDTWRAHLPDGWIIKEWNEETFHIDSIPFLRQAYDARKYGIAVDPIRASVLYQFGGVWMDTDVIMTRDISPFMQYDFFASYESSEWLNVGTLGARPGLPLFKELMAFYQKASLDSFDTDSFIEKIGTGPMTITRTLKKQIPQFDPDGHPATITHEGYTYRLESPAVFVIDDEQSGAVNFTQHLYSASWMDEPPSSWSKTVRDMYADWKRIHRINQWRG